MRTLKFYFDYYIGYFLTTSPGKWSNYMLTKYPERFPKEVEYLEQRKKDL